ncbi:MULTISPECIES: copper resistance protein NlpE [Chitinophagaceae]
MVVRNNIFSSVLIGISFIVLGCKNPNPTLENNTMDTTSTSISTAPISGVFEAVLPCADCSGIETHILLQKDFTYLKEENYQGVSDTMPHIFYDLGKWTEKDSILVLAGQTSDTTRYKIHPDTSFTLLAQDGTPIPDSVTGNFRFTYQDKTFQTKKPFLVSGVWDQTNNNTSLFICIWNKTMEASLSTNAKKQMDTLWKSLKNPAATKAILQGEASFAPDQNNKLIIQKINTIIQGDNCN